MQALNFADTLLNCVPETQKKLLSPWRQHLTQTQNKLLALPQVPWLIINFYGYSNFIPSSTLSNSVSRPWSCFVGSLANGTPYRTLMGADSEILLFDFGNSFFHKNFLRPTAHFFYNTININTGLFRVQHWIN